MATSASGIKTLFRCICPNENSAPNIVKKKRSDPDGQEREGDRNRPRPLPVSQNFRDSHSQVFHAERAGHHIEQPDADDIERRTDAAHDQILERGA
jgi:hypothetical protein